MLSDEELLKDVVEFIRNSPSNFNYMSIAMKFNIDDNKAKEILNRIWTAIEL